MSQLGVNHPETFSTVYNSDFSSMVSMTKDYNNDKEFVVKPFGGARGIGQVLLKKEDLYAFQEDCHSESISTEDLREKYSVPNCSEQNCVEDNYFRDCTKSDTVLLQRKVDIKKEWRVIYFYNDTPMIIERKVPEEGWQSNSSITGEGNQVQFLSLERGIADEIKTISTLIGSKLNVPFLSMDFYMDSFDNIGVLEFQMEMGYKFVNKFQFQHKIVRAVQNMIKDKYEKA